MVNLSAYQFSTSFHKQFACRFDNILVSLQLLSVLLYIYIYIYYSNQTQCQDGPLNPPYVYQIVSQVSQIMCLSFMAAFVQYVREKKDSIY